MKKLLIILLVLTVFFTACENDKNGNVAEEPNNEPTSLKIKDYIPFTENVKYTYEGEGNEFASYTVYIDYINDSRIQTRTLSGSEIIKIYEVSNGALTEIYSRGETYFRQNFTDKELVGGRILLKEPLEEGNSWTFENSTSTITSISKKVITTWGNVEAIEVTTENDQGTTMEYYVKDKGLVKVIHKGGGYEVSSTLANIENNIPLIQTVTLYYPDIESENLKTVDVQVSFNTNDEPKDVLEQTVKDLSAYEVISANTKINELYYNEENNSVHLDLSKEFITEMNAGAGIEGMILQSIANTLGNYYGVEDVYLTIDNEQYESGHILLKEGESLKVQ